VVIIGQNTPETTIVDTIEHDEEEDKSQEEKSRRRTDLDQSITTQPDKTRKLSYRKDDRAMRPMYGRPENFQETLTMHTATFPEFLMGFCSD